LCQARRRIGVAPLRALFDLLRGPAAAPRTAGVWWRGRLVCAVDGTQMCVPDSAANLQVYRRGGGHHGGTGYPMLRLVALVCCGTRTVIEAVFGSDGRSETAMAADLTSALRPGMIVLADRHYGYAPTITALAATGADLLIRVRNNHRYPITGRLPDGSFTSRIGTLPVRIVRVEITTHTDAGHRCEAYQMVSTICDPACSALELARLYHQRWEIETSYFELKSTILGGRVLRARTPHGIDQEVYALLVTYQALRIAIADALSDRPDLDPDRASFTIAHHRPRPTHRRRRRARLPGRPPRDHRTPSPGRPAPRPTRPNQPPRGQTRDLQLHRQDQQGPGPRPQPPLHHRDQHNPTRRPLTPRHQP
jgi:hypothetical protein